MNIDWKLILKIILILICSYFVIKWAVRKAIKEAYRSITGFPTYEDLEVFSKMNKDDLSELEEDELKRDFYNDMNDEFDIIDVLSEDQKNPNDGSKDHVKRSRKRSRK